MCSQKYDIEGANITAVADLSAEFTHEMVYDESKWMYLDILKLIRP